MLDNVIALFKSICCNLNLQGAMAAGCGWDAWDGGVPVARNWLCGSCCWAGHRQHLAAVDDSCYSLHLEEGESWYAFNVSVCLSQPEGFQNFEK
jgi:hypothetical protein